MKATTRKTAKWTLRCGVLLALTQVGVFAQTLINLGTQGRNVDFTSAQWTRPVKTGTALPATCSPGDLFFKTNAPSGQNLYGCPTANTWALLGDGSRNNKLVDPGTTGIVQRN